ncbi:OmpA family protein [Leeuwenhoekiella aequorea]|uniref:WD40 repeat protein n=1 Tax=Leeuwenhoekiella aequorea TaxID=283736 RepID=A0A4Q0P2P5_9FLAO|nr:OmpA family protein [Leeuwenhoekiella aequorea]RXG20515.1 WD40 repeat protein [Leeuwenhoekiella aequorea]
MNHKLLYTLIIILTFNFTGNSQEREIASGTKQFNKYAFVDSQKIFLKVAEAGYESSELFSKLGDAFYYNADYSEAQTWYDKLVEKYPSEVTPDQYFRYAQALRANKEYDKSVEMISRYKDMMNTEDANYYNGSSAEVRTGYVNGTYEIEKLNVNSVGYSDFAPSFYGEQILFASTRDTGSMSTRIHKWNNQPFLDLYSANVENDGQVRQATKLKGSVNTEFHESTAVLSADGNTLYFTRNNFTKDQYRSDSKRTNKLKLYKSIRDKNGEFGVASELPFNSDSFSTAHPALSPDGKVLYFASDRDGTFGESDIWKVTVDESGNYSSPENLGTSVNTPGRETFPFVDNNGKLYFSTDGRGGLGGLDVYSFDSEKNEITNLGEPINSTSDDFTFIYNTESETGYFASNRANDPLDDDIYQFIRTACESRVTILVVDKATGEPLNKSLVGVRDLDNELLVSGETESPNASYLFENPSCDADYFVRAEKEGYSTAEKLINVPKESSDVTVVIELEPAITTIPPDFDLGKLINPIYFDFDKSNIRSDAAVELAKIIEVLKEYPELRIDVRSHTDSRGVDAYNLSLSERRNQSTINYIIEKGGIAKERLSGRGYGETELLNKCSNGVKCSEEDHQLNRRSEFIVQDY